MYKCQNCRKQIGPGILSQRVTQETRAVQYPFRKGTNRFIRERKIILTNDNGGTGLQISREIVVCPVCVEVLS